MQVPAYFLASAHFFAATMLGGNLACKKLSEAVQLSGGGAGPGDGLGLGAGPGAGPGGGVCATSHQWEWRKNWRSPRDNHRAEGSTGNLDFDTQNPWFSALYHVHGFNPCMNHRFVFPTKHATDDEGIEKKKRK
jgi:hypothetical protein